MLPSTALGLLQSSSNTCFDPWLPSASTPAHWWVFCCWCMDSSRCYRLIRLVADVHHWVHNLHAPCVHGLADRRQLLSLCSLRACFPCWQARARLICSLFACLLDVSFLPECMHAMRACLFFAPASVGRKEPGHTQRWYRAALTVNCKRQPVV
jgi:hypothetical protein